MALPLVVGGLSKPRGRRLGGSVLNDMRFTPLLGPTGGDPSPSTERDCRDTRTNLPEWRGPKTTGSLAQLLEEPT